MGKCWCGDDHEPHCPTCGKCGAPVTTGAMALLCPLRTKCEFWPEGMDENCEIAQMFRPAEPQEAKHES